MLLSRSCCHLCLACLLLQGCATQLQPRSSYPSPPGASPQEVGDVDTGELKPTAGHQDELLGARVLSSREVGDEQHIEIEVPVDPDRVDQVQVYSSQAGSGSVVLTREAQIVQKY